MYIIYTNNKRKKDVMISKCITVDPTTQEKFNTDYPNKSEVEIAKSLWRRTNNNNNNNLSSK